MTTAAPPTEEGVALTSMGTLGTGFTTMGVEAEEETEVPDALVAVTVNV